MSDRYWIGGSGNWSDTNHWSTTSGGSSGASAPVSGDNTYINSSSGDGTLTLDMDIECANIYQQSGSSMNLNTASHTIQVGTLQIVNDSGETYDLILGSSNIYISGWFDIAFSISRVDYGNSTIYMVGTSMQFRNTFNQGTVNNLICQNGTVSLIFGCYINNLTISPGATVKLREEDTFYITNSFIANGTDINPITITSTTSGTAGILSKSSGIIECDYLNIKDCTTTGGAAWFAGSHSINSGNNSGWIFKDNKPIVDNKYALPAFSM